jgi:methionine synthase I (cobalamin-dependent)
MAHWVHSYRTTLTVADGAWSTQLWARGVPSSAPAELANLTHPQQVALLARDYIAAGARILSTNTFACHPLHFERRGIGGDPLAVVQAGVELVRNAAMSAVNVRVAGVIGPSGAILAVREIAEATIAEGFAGLAKTLAAGGAEIIVLETFSELAEILLAIKAVRGVCDLPIAASMSYDSGPQRTHTIMGASVEECAAALAAAGAAVLGCNCGAGVAASVAAVAALRAAFDGPILARPSVGVPDLEDGRPVYRIKPEEFVAAMPELIDAGATILGGCCGTGPDHIRRLAALVEARGKRKPKSTRI